VDYPRVRDHSQDEVEGRVGNGDALTGVGVDVPVGDELTVVVGDVQSGEWGVTRMISRIWSSSFLGRSFISSSWAVAYA